MDDKIKTPSEKRVCVLSDELFSHFFASDKALTEKIINALLGADFSVDEITPCEVDRARFGFYHPFLLIDAHTKSGRCSIALTHIGEDAEEAASDILNWMLYHVSLERRNIYTILISFDSTDSYVNESSPVSLRLVDSYPRSFALAVIWTKMENDNASVSSLIRDLTAGSAKEIRDDDIRRAYIKSYEKSGLGEMADVSYSMWLRSLESDIEKLGIKSR